MADIPQNRKPVRAKTAVSAPSSNGARVGRPSADKLKSRLQNLTTGRYQIILTVHADGRMDWTVSDIGKIEY